MLSKKQLTSYVKIQQDNQGNEQKLLDLSKKQLRKINQIDLNALKISKIDLSYNFLKSFNAINIVRNQNTPQQKYAKSQTYQQHVQFSWLDISFNVIDSIDLQTQSNKEHFRQLQYLNACTNKIETVNLTDKTYPYLKQLHLKNNQIKYFVHCPSSVEVLTLDKNFLTELAFSGGKNLEILSASNNKIHKIGTFFTQLKAIKTPELTFLDLEGNEVFDLDMFFEFLQTTKKILSINMLENPINFNKNYKIIVLSTCPEIVQIDEVHINPHVREGFRILRQEQKLQEVLQKTTQNYKNRLEEQLKYKEQMIEKLKLQQKQIEEKFMSYCQRQKEEMLILEDHAKNTLGQRKFKIAEQKEQFEKKMQSNEKKQPLSISPTKFKNQNTIIQSPKKQKKIFVQEQQQKYKSEYEQFRRQSMRRQMKINLVQLQKKNQNQGRSNLDIPLNEGDSNRLVDQKNLSSQRNKNLKKTSYRQSRQNILKNKLKEKGHQEKTDNQNSQANNIAQTSPINKETVKNIQLGDIIDLRCIQFLKKSYSFYQ